MRKRSALALISAIVLVVSAGAFYFLSRTPNEPSPSAPIRGITLDSIEHFDTTLSLLRTSTKKLTVRLVLDAENDLEDYKNAVEQLAPYASIMVQIADSEEMPTSNVADIQHRTQTALETFGDKVSLWEIGNELNGSWVGTSPHQINEKAVAAYRIIHDAGKPTALTLNYWSTPDCYEYDWESTISYAEHLPAELKHTDYVFLSVYETACNPPQHPSAQQLADMLHSLASIFPHALLGIGEIGIQNSSDGINTQNTLVAKQNVASHYYGMHNELKHRVGPRFCGGYFWWYFYEDAVLPESQHRLESLWPTLQKLTSEL